MNTRIVLSYFLILFMSVGVFAQRNKQKQHDPYRYKLEEGKLKLETTYLSLGDVFNTKTKSKTVGLLNNTDKPMSIEFVSKPKFITASIEPKVIPPMSKATLKVVYDAQGNKNYKKKQNWGYQTHRLRLVVNGNKSNTRNYITVRANIKEDFASMTPEQLKNAPKIKFDELVYDFGTVKQGEKVVHEFKFTNLGNNDLEIRKVKGT